MLKINKLNINDPLIKNHINKFTELSKKAFDDDSIRFTIGFDGPPGYQDNNFTSYVIEHCETYFIELSVNELDETTKLDDEYDEFIIIGGVIMYYEENKCMVGRIFIDPTYQGKGFGKRIMNIIENKYQKEPCLYLDTPIINVRTNQFYTSLGYLIYKTDDFLNYYVKRLGNDTL